MELKNRLSCLSVEDEEEENRSERALALALASENEVERKWEKVRDTFFETPRDVLVSEQGCSMSGFLFLIVIDWIMGRTVPDNSTLVSDGNCGIS